MFTSNFSHQQQFLMFYDKMGPSSQMKIIYNVKNRYAIRVKFREKFLTSPTKLMLEKKASFCSTIKKKSTFIVA